MDKSRILSVVALAAILSHSYAVAQSIQAPGANAIETQTSHLRSPVGITVIPLMDGRIGLALMGFLPGLQAGEGAVWAATDRGTLRLDPQTQQMVTTPSPARGVGLFIGEGSLWSSGGNAVNWGMPASKETLTLHRIDPQTRQVIASIDAAGDVFATGNGKIWALNPQTRSIVVIDAKTNQVVDTIPTQRKGQLAMGGGAIWQLSGQSEKLGDAEVVRRIDPHTKGVVAEIPVGPYSYATISFIEGAIWIVGPRGNGVGIVERIDVNTNRVVATIPVKDRPKTPVYWNGGLWISTFVRNRGGGVYPLVKIDTQTNEVVDEIILSGAGQPLLVAGEGAIWTFNRDFIRRIDFMVAKQQ